VLFAGGEITHVARKRPAQGDPAAFCVQEHLGGTTVLDPSPDPRAIALAHKAFAAATAITGEQLMYCRVDMFLSEDGAGFMLSELEATEPSLYHPLCPHSAKVLATKHIEE
jgi:hypothetical protein